MARWHLFKMILERTIVLSPTKLGHRAFHSMTVLNFDELAVESQRFQQLTGSGKSGRALLKVVICAKKGIFTFKI
jgi:hypothetical protein